MKVGDGGGDGNRVSEGKKGARTAAESENSGGSSFSRRSFLPRHRGGVE